MATVEIHCIPDNVHALLGVLNQKKVRFDIQTKSTDGAQAKRSPLNLALILDRSGSMEGNEKLTFAKRAIISCLQLLHDDDLVHLIAYDDDITVVFENARAGARAALVPLIERITAGGSTNISGAIDVAANLLLRHNAEGYAKRMFLFSDGQANVGLQRHEELSALVKTYNQQGILTDSFGIGADFDAAVMKGIADAGGSRFVFLESVQVIEPFVSKALMSVFNVCGSQTQLIIRGTNGAVLTKIYGHENLVTGANLGDLHVNNVRSVLAEFTIPGTGNPDGSDVVALTYELRYYQPSNLQGEPTVLRGSLSLKFVQDASLVTEIDPRVRAMHATQMAADMDVRIVDLIRNGRRKDALSIVEEQIALLQSVVQCDDHRGTIALLIRIAESMQKRLQDERVNDTLVCQGYAHQSYLKRQASCDYMERFGLYD